MKKERISQVLLLCGLFMVAAGMAVSSGERALPEMLLRWLGVFCFVPFLLMNGKFTHWILWSMVFGIVLGLDFPEVAKGSKVLSSIFLQLIKSVVAPLLFGTLVVGIAGHANLKQVGRMGQSLCCTLKL
jgi:proton glutamate symport protein